MSKANENKPGESGNPPPTDENKSGGSGNPPPQAGNGAVRSMEEHAANLKVDPAVLAAVTQAEKWGAGKRLSEGDFKKAVKAFETGPMEGPKEGAVEEAREKPKEAGDASGN